MLLKIHAYPSHEGHQFFRRAGFCFATGSTVEIEGTAELAKELRASGRLSVEEATEPVIGDSSNTESTQSTQNQNTDPDPATTDAALEPPPEVVAEFATEDEPKKNKRK